MVIERGVHFGRNLRDVDIERAVLALEDQYYFREGGHP